MNIENIARRAWLEYYIITEEFDRALPGVWSPREQDCWLPFDTSASRRHATRVRRHVELFLAQFGIPPEQHREVMSWAAEYTYARQMELLAGLGGAVVVWPEMKEGRRDHLL